MEAVAAGDPAAAEASVEVALAEAVASAEVASEAARVRAALAVALITDRREGLASALDLARVIIILARVTITGAVEAVLADSSVSS